MIFLRGEGLAAREFLPQPGWLIRIHTGSADGLLQQSAGRERVVAHHFRGQPEAWPASQQAILRVFFEQLRADLRGLPVGGGGDDQPLHRLHVPVGFKFRGQPVQQFAIGRCVTLRAEILRGLDQPDSEVELPVSIDRDARGQRMLCGEQPAGKTQPVPGVTFSV